MYDTRSNCFCHVCSVPSPYDECRCVRIKVSPYTRYTSTYMRKRIQRVCRQVCDTPPQMKRKIRIAYWTLIIIAILASAFIVAIAEFERHRLEEAARQSEAPPFPVSVDPELRRIVENPEVDTYFAVHISARSNQTRKLSWVVDTLEKVAGSAWYQQLASPTARVLVIQPGERKEEIAEKFGELLNWSDRERAAFLTHVDRSSLRLDEGTYAPGRYLTHVDATPREVALLIATEFDAEILTRYTKEVAAQVPIEQTLIIASLLEREAYDFTDMREISGIIWNRLFADMHLQLDATLQYAKADGTDGIWWPRAVPDDKYIDSPFNTYEHKGLPPAPIANPSLDAMLAALNPTETDCMFYFHDAYSRFHCSETYEEHVERLKVHYGQGR